VSWVRKQRDEGGEVNNIELVEYKSIPDGCPKCGMDGDIGVGTTYIKEKKVEYLKCTCCKCGYWWGMKTGDSEESRANK
jgi:hypothetical protein